MNLDVKPRPPSIRDVAALANVSYQTVSRVLNDHPSIKPQTHQRVLDAIETLGYRPNAAARALAQNRSKLIGILTTSLQYYGPSAAVVSIQQAAIEAGYWVSIANIDEDRPESVQEGITRLRSQSVEGIVVIAPQQQIFDTLARLSINVPFVTLQGTLASGDHALAVDQEVGARLAARHLIELGHRSICQITGPSHWIEAEARSRGFAEELAAHGLEVRPPIVGDWTAEFGYRAGAQVLVSGCTAVFCANDQMALGLLHACHDAGRAVPAELSVVGFDDIPEAAHMIPPLTTVRQDFALLGRRCVAVLLSSIEATEQVVPVSIAPELVVRASTAAPAVRS